MNNKKIILLLGGLFISSFMTCSSFEKIKQIYEASGHAQKVDAFLSMMDGAQRCCSNREVLGVALQHVCIDGLYLEMGVFSGSSINYIAGQKRNQVVHGFDSFEGLPEDWQRDDTKMFAKGYFAMKGLPKVASNVKLYKGWFDESLPEFKQNVLKDQPIAFIHIDCDLYSSTKTVFDILGDNIIDGTIIVFDELYRYPGFENHELKALYEFLKMKSLFVQYFAYNINHEQVAVKIIAS